MLVKTAFAFEGFIKETENWGDFSKYRLDKFSYLKCNLGFLATKLEFKEFLRNKKQLRLLLEGCLCYCTYVLM